MIRPGHGDGPERGPLLALFAAALVLFNFPMMLVFDRDVTVFGLPLLAVAVFSVWAGLIGLLIWVSERPARRGGRRPRRPVQPPAEGRADDA